jgi:uncharacterized protein YciI
MKHFLLFYDYVPDYLDRRVALRPAHFEHAKQAVGRGELQLGGACVDETPYVGVLLFKGETKAVAEDFARNDPYVTQGLVASWRVREWTTVVGESALTKV